MHVFLGHSLKNKVVNPKNKSGFVTSGIVLVSDRSPPNVFPSVVLLPVSMFVASPHCLYMKEQVTFVEAALLINITVPNVAHSIRYRHRVQWRIQETNNNNTNNRRKIVCVLESNHCMTCYVFMLNSLVQTCTSPL